MNTNIQTISMKIGRVVVAFVMLGVIFSCLEKSASAASRGSVVALKGTPHIWIADEAGVLHWGGDTRALAGKYIAWLDRTEVTIDQLRDYPIGDPWLTAGLLKDQSPIYLVKWETNWQSPILYHIQSIDDVRLFGISGSNYGRFVIEKAEWEKRFEFTADSLKRDKLAPAASAPLGSRENPIPRGQSAATPDGWEIQVMGSTPNANDIIAKTNQFNKKAASGNQYFIVNLKFVRTGSTPSTIPTFEISLVGKNNIVYDYMSRCGVYPNDISGELYPAGSKSGNRCWEISSSDADSAVIVYRSILNDFRIHFSTN